MTSFSCPFVSPNDDGIRPAGPQDACLYCRQKVGSRHLFSCVTLTVPRTYRVLLDGVDIGSWSTDDPVSWDVGAREFHKNDGSWCSDNVTHVGTLTLVSPLPIERRGCLCSCLAFEAVEGEPEYEEARPCEPEGGGS